MVKPTLECEGTGRGAELHQRCDAVGVGRAGFEHSVVIDGPIEEGLISDLANASKWGLWREARQTSPGPIGVGTTFQQILRVLGKELFVTDL